MGGCRCTYRNCTVRSDGKTHLFHYPVFDKVRCHQWLINARRYDFLQLKLSQLKNRCICQHHFPDNSFMNDKKEKLKVEAIPTLDGPYSDPSKFDYPETQHNQFGLLYPIAEDIENDEYISDRKANYNLKYADFLTNCELVEPLKDVVENTQDAQEKANVTVYTLSKNNLLKNSVIDIRPDLDKKSQYIENEHLPVEFNIAHKTTEVDIPLQQEKRKKSQIRIISEKKIPPGKKKLVPGSTDLFKKVEPSMILRLDNKKKDTAILNNNNNNNLAPLSLGHNEKRDKKKDNVAPPKLLNLNNKIQDSKVNYLTQQPSKENEQSVTEILNTHDPSQFEIRIDMNGNVPLTPKISNEKKATNIPITNRKISAERVAAINEKRKFNMKLKDIIEAGLNRLDNEDVAKSKCKIQNKHPAKKIDTETAASSLSKEKSLPGHSEYVVSYLEARMKRMENLLLSKIDQNTSKITDLKKTLDPESKDQPVSARSTKSTKLYGEAHKKYLYSEISQYLTPETNNLLYEELFIDKYKPNTEPEPPKKRKHR